jgi:hypothetical protein
MGKKKSKADHPLDLFRASLKKSLASDRAGKDRPKANNRSVRINHRRSLLEEEEDE